MILRRASRNCLQWSRDVEGDRYVAALLVAKAFTEIRYLAQKAQRTPEGQPTDDVLERIRLLADLCHNLPGTLRPRQRLPSRSGAPVSSRERAMKKRHIAGPEGQAWMLGHIEQDGLRWTPPPPLPVHRRRSPSLTLREEARAFLTLYQIPRSTTGPDGRGGEIRWWQCTALLRMYDGEQVSSMIAVLPETFTALSSNLRPREQRRPVHLANIDKNILCVQDDFRDEGSPVP